VISGAEDAAEDGGPGEALVSRGLHDELVRGCVRGAISALQVDPEEDLLGEVAHQRLSIRLGFAGNDDAQPHGQESKQHAQQNIEDRFQGGIIVDQAARLECKG
jgi:hypothetical protein